MKRRYVRISGKSTDGKTIITGVFQMMSSTTGLPLEMILNLMQKRNMLPDWIDFWEQGEKEGWKYQTLRTRIDTAVGDVFGTPYKDEVLKRLDFWLSQRPSFRSSR